jgi:hypothetical protein
MENKLSKLSKLSSFMNLHGRLIEIMAMIFTLIFIAFQTLQMNLNIDEIKKSVVLDSHQAVHNHRQRINNILLNNSPELAMKVFGLDKPKLIGFTMSTDYESLFNMKCSGLLSENMWGDIEIMMQKTLKSTFMTEFWEEFHPAVSASFASYVSELKDSLTIAHGRVDFYCSQKNGKT